MTQSLLQKNKISSFRNKEHIVFDLDGTLIDSAETILMSLEKALSVNGVSTKKSLSKSIIGSPIEEIIRNILPKSPITEISKVFESFLNIYDEEYCTKCLLFEKTHQTLEKLSKVKEISLVTNKRKKPSKSILKAKKIYDYFSYIYCIDSVFKMKTDKKDLLSLLMKSINIDSSKIVYIGDTEDDFQSCKEIELDFIFASWGYGDRTGLDCAFIKKIDKLVELLKK